VNLGKFLDDYIEAIYHAGDPDAAERFIADPCIRHEHGHQVVLSLAENKQRIADFLAQTSGAVFGNRVVLSEGEFLATAYEFSFGEGDAQKTLSGMEIFRIEDGKITETWNATGGEGPWG
jgi:predicted SnoaL-like aldol condensation-catalyzing enzyme